jgi:hypothetical protein
MIACWWDANNNMKHVTNVEEFVMRSVTNIYMFACFAFHVSNDLYSIIGFAIVRICIIQYIR